MTSLQGWPYGIQDVLRAAGKLPQDNSQSLQRYAPQWVHGQRYTLDEMRTLFKRRQEIHREQLSKHQDMFTKPMMPLKHLVSLRTDWDMATECCEAMFIAYHRYCCKELFERFLRGFGVRNLRDMSWDQSCNLILMFKTLFESSEPVTSSDSIEDADRPPWRQPQFRPQLEAFVNAMPRQGWCTYATVSETILNEGDEGRKSIRKLPNTESWSTPGSFVDKSPAVWQGGEGAFNTEEKRRQRMAEKKSRLQAQTASWPDRPTSSAFAMAAPQLPSPGTPLKTSNGFDVLSPFDNMEGENTPAEDANPPQPPETLPRRSLPTNRPYVPPMARSTTDSPFSSLQKKKERVAERSGRLAESSASEYPPSTPSNQRHSLSFGSSWRQSPYRDERKNSSNMNRPHTDGRDKDWRRKEE